MPLNATERIFRWHHRTYILTKDFRAVIPSGNMLDFQMPKKPVAKTNKGLFIMKYEALCFVWRHITVTTPRCVPMGKGTTDNADSSRNLFLLNIT
jgi:hypothetical protein